MGALVDLVERDDELSSLQDLLIETFQGRKRVAVVTGAVATGKTALLHTFAGHAVNSGSVFLSATASRAERDVPLGVIGQLLRSANLSAAENDRVTRLLDSAALTLALQSADSEMTADIPFPVLNGLWKVIHGLVQRTPVLIGVDDMHYADAPSLRCLLYLARQLRTARLLVVLNDCMRPVQAHPEFHAELRGQPYFRYFKLEPLSLIAVRNVVSRVFGHQAADQLSAAFHEMSGGNPLLLQALIEDHRSQREKGRLEVQPGERFGQAVSNFVYRCENSMMNVARVTAVLGDQASVGRIAEILGEDVDSIKRSGSALTASGLMKGGRYGHEAVRNAVLNGMIPEERGALHGRAAEVLHDLGLPAHVVARHLVAARWAMAPWAMPVLQDAAEQELAGGDATVAIRCLRLLRETCVDEPQRSAVTSALSGAEWQVDPSLVIRLFPELIEAARGEYLTGRNLVRLLTYLFWHGWDEQAAEVADLMQGRTEQPGPGEAEDRGDPRLWLSWLYPGRRARSARERAMDPAGGPAAATMVKRVEVGDDQLIAAEQVLLRCRLDDAAFPSCLAALATLIYGGALESAAGWCRRLLKKAENRGVTMWRALLSATLALIDVRRGDLASAKRHGKAALTLISPQSWGVAVGIPLSSMVLTTTARAEYQEAATLLEVPVPEKMFQTICGPLYMYARGRYYLAIDEPRTALADFESCGSLLVGWGFDQPLNIPWRTHAAESHLRLGRTAQATELLEKQIFRLKPQDQLGRGGPVQRIMQVADPEERVRLLRELVDTLDTGEDWMESAFALVKLSHAYAALERRDASEQAARRACWMITHRGAEPLKPVPSIGAISESAIKKRGPASAELSGAERRVAMLAAEGRSNQQIASRLFITISTVEQHLTRVYRKLGLSRRSELSAALRKSPGGDKPSERQPSGN
ncbi:hypothetical protein DPM19_28590 [Actinomadura craniellae]|uniref:HTH luxR-type domain-containing protein n=1 Tax=Actinomadura craniellae TaxID=2231787 RepID=A0A365GYK1_9ACTN|nr:LuxR family transcriptional regulator [Actinomadura craniellae]RAY11924.1 hypothetical protein DPM19_28590 [Actinomadura craniellae]